MLRGAGFVKICKYGPKHDEMIMFFKISVKSTENVYSLCNWVSVLPIEFNLTTNKRK